LNPGGARRSVAQGGLNRPVGVAISQGDSLFIADTSNNVVWNGSALWAGNDCGQAGFGGDTGPAVTHGPNNGYCTSPWSPNPAEMNQPNGVAVDDSNGAVYIADTYNCRIRSANGVITTIAGNGTCGNSGDGGQATGASLNYPAAVAGRNGKVYIADTSNDRVRVIDLSTGVISPFTTVTAPKGLAVDSVSNVYIGGSDGKVYRVNPAGTKTTVASLPNNPYTGGATPVQGLARDLLGNLYVSGGSKVYKVSGYNSPATVSSISTTVHTGAPMYAMDVSFNLSGVSCPATARVTIGTSLTRYNPLCSSGDPAPTSGTVSAISVLSLNPQSPYTVKVTIDDANGTSPAGTGTLNTPKAPLIVALGDSITSGHHRLTNDPAMTCDDADYGYPKYFVDAVKASLPAQWAPQYVNVAHSGFSTGQVINNGANACGVTPPDVPLTKAEALLSDNSGSWNYALVTAAIDNTNWGDVVTTVGSNSATSLNYTQADCTNDVSTWNGWQQATIGQQISNDVSTIVDGLHGADLTVKIDWLGYYNIAGTGPIPSVCEQPFNDAMTQLHGYITAGLSGHSGTFVQIDPVMHMRSVLIQGYQLPWDTQQGWPHPNSAGAAAIAGAIQP
jgi:hypothetical protein